MNIITRNVKTPVYKNKTIKWNRQFFLPNQLLSIKHITYSYTILVHRFILLSSSVAALIPAKTLFPATQNTTKKCSFFFLIVHYDITEN